MESKSLGEFIRTKKHFKGAQNDEKAGGVVTGL